MIWKLNADWRNQSLIANWMNINYEIWAGNCKLLIDLISLIIKGYDIIPGVNFEDEIPFKEVKM